MSLYFFLSFFVNSILFTIVVVIVSLGTTGTLKKDAKQSDTASSSPKQRASIGTSNSHFNNSEQTIEQCYPDNNVASGGNLNVQMVN